MNNVKKFYVFFILLGTFFEEGWAAANSRNPGIRPTVTISPKNVHVRENPKITAADVNFDVIRSPLSRNMEPTFERMANEMAILVNNLYKRRELDEVNVRSLMRTRVYLAFVYRKTKQPKLLARIFEAIREINEELKHRLDFEERYRSGLIKIPTSRSVSTQGTQTEEGIGEGVSFGQNPSIRRAEDGTETQGLNPHAVSQPASGTSKQKGLTAQSKSEVQTPADPSALSSRGQAILNLVQSGKIDSSQLTKKDQNLIAPYLNIPGSSASQESPPQISRQIIAKSQLSSPPSGEGPRSQPLAASSGEGRRIETPPGEGVKRHSNNNSNLSVRGQAILRLIESGKLQESDLSPQDRIRLNEYRSSAAYSQSLSQPQAVAASSAKEVSRPLQSSQGVIPLSPALVNAPPPPPPPPPPALPGGVNAGSQPTANSAPPSASLQGQPSNQALSSRANALLNLVRSGKLQENQLSPADRALLQNYLHPSSGTDLSQLPPPPPEFLEPRSDS